MLFSALLLLFQNLLTLLVLLDFATVDFDAEQGDRLLILVEFVRLVVSGTLLPNSGQLIVRDWNLEVLAELSVASEPKHNKVFRHLAEVAFGVSVLAAVKIEHLEKVLIDNFLFFGSY